MLWKEVDIYVNHSRHLCRLCQNSIMDIYVNLNGQIAADIHAGNACLGRKGGAKPHAYQHHIRYSRMVLVCVWSGPHPFRF
jgi:hypothetical protein